MRKLVLTAIAVVATCAAAHAEVTAICRLERGAVTVAFTNSENKTMQCEVNCDMALAGGIGTVVCVKPVPGGAKDLVMCTERSDGPPYTRVRSQEVNCRDPQGAPVTPAEKKDDDDDDDKLGEDIRQKSLDMLKQIQKNQK